MLNANVCSFFTRLFTKLIKYKLEELKTVHIPFDCDDPSPFNDLLMSVVRGLEAADAVKKSVPAVSSI